MLHPGVGPTSCLATGHLDLGLELGLDMVQPIRKLPWQWCGLLAFEPSLGAGGRKVRGRLAVEFSTLSETLSELLGWFWLAAVYFYFIVLLRQALAM